jgi:hypothetical protein
MSKHIWVALAAVLALTALARPIALPARVVDLSFSERCAPVEDALQSGEFAIDRSAADIRY